MIRRSIRQRHRDQAQLQSQYTISELSEMSGLPTARLRGLLKRKRMVLDRQGKRNYVVYLHMLISKAPELWRSILERERLRRQPTPPSPDLDEE